MVDAKEKVNNVKKYNFGRPKSQYSECSSKERMHHTQQKLDPIMKFTVQNKNRKQQQIRRKTLGSALKTCIQEKNTKQDQVRCKNPDNNAYSKIEQKRTKQRHARHKNLDVVTKVESRKTLNNIKSDV